MSFYARNDHKSTTRGAEGKKGSVLDANPPMEGLSEPAAPFEARSERPDLSQVEAIFFDLDDTLCAYWEACKIGLCRALDAHGPEGFTSQEVIRAWAAAFREFSPTLKETGWYEGYLTSGEPTRTEQMRLTLLRLGIADEDLASKLSEAYRTERDKALRLFEESEEVLSVLQKRYPLGLITNGPADIQRQEIATLGIEDIFDPILIEGEMGEGKPLASVFRRAEKLVGKEPSQLLFVGNSYGHDIRPALDAGWRAVWVRRPTDVPPSAGPGPSRPEEMPKNAPPPDAIVQNLRELLPLLGL
jgi:putative hydrolase of the HAD superfamily